MRRLPQPAPRLLLIGVLGLAACGGVTSPEPSMSKPKTASAAPTEPPATRSPAATATVAATITLRDHGCELAGPAQAPAGMVTLELEETSSGLFDADLWRLQGGHAYDELAAHIAEEQRLADAGLPGLGHPTFADLIAEETGVADHGQLTARMDASTYGVACIEIEDAIPVRIWAAGPITITD